MQRRTRRILAGAVMAAALALTNVAVAGAGTGAEAELAEVRRATARYHDVERAVADGYVRRSGCVPHMGYHYVRSVAGDASELQPTVPNILVYAPRGDGSLRLVAVEYASMKPATLFGRAFDPPHSGGPPFHTLHAWIWQANPDGTFAALNRNISCT